ncbi:MAG: hypothetical protein QOC65_650 [Sphingomonadales bacterium]|nr:hypothetical protein [Sphingomonadales bacterium]
MAAVAGAVVHHFEPLGSEGGAQALVDLGGDGAGESIGHRAYIEALDGKGRRVLASAGRKEGRFHGRIEGQGMCAEPGCVAPGEFRAPAGRGPSFNGPGEWRLLCLDHVRAFNAGYNYFGGMSAEEISAAQNPYGGWDRETRAFASVGGSAPPRWSDFTEPLDAIGARFRRASAEGPRRDGRELSEGDRKSLRVLGLGTDADRRTLRRRYADLLRRYHPDHNGGDRGHEKALQAVIDAYTQLKSRPAFA